MAVKRLRDRKTNRPRFNGAGQPLWQVDWAPWPGKRKFVQIAGDRSTADHFYAERLAERQRDRLGVPMPPRPLAAAVAEYLERLKALNKSEAYRRNMTRTLRGIVAEIGDKAMVEALSYSWLEAYQERRAREGGPWAARRELAEICAFLAGEVKAGRIRENPVTRIDRVVINARPARWLDAAEYAKLWQLATPEVRDAMDVLVTLGLRHKEILGLRPECVRGFQLQILNRKARDFLCLPVGPHLLAVLLPRLGNLPWPGLKGLSHVLGRLARKAGLERVSAHVLRHTCACWLLESGAEKARIQAWLGHSTVTTTEIYAKLTAGFDWRAESAKLPDRTREIFTRTTSFLRPPASIQHHSNTPDTVNSGGSPVNVIKASEGSKSRGEAGLDAKTA